MLVGYVDDCGGFFCAACWNAEASAGRRPAQTLDNQEREREPDDASNFWVVDDCTKCARRIQYKTVRLLA